MRLGFSLNRACIAFNANAQKSYEERILKAQSEKKESIDDIPPPDKVNYARITEWINESEELEELVNSFKISVALIASDVVVNAIIDQNNPDRVNDAKWWLKNRHSEDFHEAVDNRSSVIDEKDLTE